ncbi:MAG: hypothetical protein IT303_17000 [Dehalococcoidia bacterium]|nr:hypothetical protein [Dehalococcoidia bacterium]
MFVFDWGVELLFGTLYGGLVTLIALFAAIPYGIWQGIKRVGRRLSGGNNGNA